MRTYFDRELLQQSSIFELRNIARDIGVYSPTIYKKEELIEKIFQIVNGEVKPHVPKSKQGRPPKSLSNPSRKSVFDSLLPTDEQMYTIEQVSLPCLSESVIAFLEDEKIAVKKNFDIEGVLEVSPYGYGFVREKAKAYTSFGGAFISQNMINAHKLKSGFYIKGKAKVLEPDKPYVLYDIESVSNQAQFDFDNAEVVCSLSRLELNSEIDNFLQGAANLIIQDKSSETSVFDYVKDCKDAEIVIVKLDANKEQEFVQKSLQNENYFTTMLQNPAEHIAVIKFALARAKQLVAEGKSVVLCIDSIDKALKNQNAVNNNDLLDVKSTTFDIIKVLSMAARNFENQKALTIVGLYNYKQNNNFDEVVVSELEDYFTKIYKVKKQG